jgi:hypothetical protein
MPYKVGRFAGVPKQMRALADYAALAGIRQAYLDALKRMLAHLEQDPLAWGDPLYRIKHKSGVVCHVCMEPIAVRYVVFEEEQSVLIIDIRPVVEWRVRP